MLVRTLFLFILTIFFTSLGWADVYLSVSESATQLSGKSVTDGTKGQLTSYFSPGVSALILANYSNKFRLNFSASFLQANFIAPASRNLNEKKLVLSNYSAGPLYKFSEKHELKINLGFEDFPYYRALNQYDIVLAKQNGSFFSLAYKYYPKDFFLTSWEVQTKIATPVNSDFDQGMTVLAAKISVEKELMEKQFTYFAGSFVGYQNIPMATIKYSKTEVGFYFLVKIPVKTKNIL